MATNVRTVKQVGGLCKHPSHLILITTRGASPLRAWKTIDGCDSTDERDEHPQCASRRKLNLRGRSFVQANAVAVAATMRRAVVSCQSMPRNITAPSQYATEIFLAI